jgi:DNA-binding NarL/FixJ family response regulator
MDRAATLWGAATRMLQSLGVKSENFGVFTDKRQEHIKSVRDALGEAEFDRCYHRGKTMTRPEVLDYVLRSPGPEPPGIELTAREQEIAGLVAEGLTNQEIADQLIISPRTAETHVGNILAKLDVHSRAAVAAWQASHDADPRRTSASGSRRR